MDPERRRYFAYGSNLATAQMARRCPQAVAGSVVTLPGWRFIINSDGVATILPDEKARVIGLTWHLTRRCERALDLYEGVAHDIYRRAEFTVDGRPALVYLARETQPGPPLAGYLEEILASAKRLGMAADYVAELARWGRPETIGPDTTGPETSAPGATGPAPGGRR